jgi:hypothetical protein
MVRIETVLYRKAQYVVGSAHCRRGLIAMSGWAATSVTTTEDRGPLGRACGLPRISGGVQ